MKVAVVYVYPMVQVRTYFPLARRFSDTWKRYAPSIPHDLHVIANGATPTANERAPFNGIPCQFHTYSNIGLDIGAYQWACDNIPCDLLVCLGAPVHFHKAGWLERMVNAFVENGPALYGCWAYLSPNWHVRTTVFWCPPQLLQSYPDQVGSTKASRYNFEHGNQSFTRHVLSVGMECYMVTQQGCFPFSQWESRAPGPDNSLVLDQHNHR